MRQLFTTLGIAIPIVQAPMGGAVPVRLAAAVSDAGALGTLPLWRADLETLRDTVRKMRGLTSKPFAVNLVTEFLNKSVSRYALRKACRSSRSFGATPAP